MLRIRLDKTVNEGQYVNKRNCNLNCIWCHNDYFEHNGFYALKNKEYVKIIKNVIEASGEKDVYIRLGGNGDPLMVKKKELSDFINQLKQTNLFSSIDLTTNGTRLKKYAYELKSIGLNSITVSINSLDKEQYSRITGKNELMNVLGGITYARDIGLIIKINSIFSTFNKNEIELYERLSIEKNIKIKFFDLLYNERTKKYFCKLEELKSLLKPRIKKFEYTEDPYPKEIYYLDSGAIFQLKTAGKINLCPNVSCDFRTFCLEGCRHSIRIGIDGILRPCGIRTDNILDLMNNEISSEAIWKSLYSGGKVGY